MLKISLAGANNSVPATGLTPSIIIVHIYTCIYSGAEKISTPAGILWHHEWRHSANSTPLGFAAPRDRISCYQHYDLEKIAQTLL